MFNYSEKDLYDRDGSLDIPINNDRKPIFNGEYAEVDGEMIPVINFNFQPGIEFSSQVCLKTIFGYIPINNINQFKDIFNLSKYCQDKTEWSSQYNEKNADENTKQCVKKLSLALGKHWKENS